LFAWDGGDICGEPEVCGFACGVNNVKGGLIVVQGDLLHGDALEISSVVAGWLQGCGFELGCDVVCCALVGFGAGVAALHGVVREGGSLGPPGSGGGVRFVRRLCGGGERKKDY